MATRREKSYSRRMAALIKNAGKLEAAELQRVFDLLTAARVEVAARVAQTPWQVARIPELRNAIDRAMDGFLRQYGAGHVEALNTAWALGIDMVDGPLASAGIRTLAGELPRTTLEVLQGYSVDLLDGMGRDAVKKINAEISMGIMGQKPVHEVMKGIGRNLEEKNVMRTILKRAETITRTELANVQSASRQARILAVNEAGTEPEMRWQKMWIAGHRAFPREDHQMLDGMKVDMDEDFPGGIPYPHAPGLSAADVVNCGCTHVMDSPDWQKLPKTFDPIPYEDRSQL